MILAARRVKASNSHFPEPKRTAFALHTHSSNTDDRASSRNAISRRAIPIDRARTTIAVLFLTMDTAMKLLRVPQAVEGIVQICYPVSVIFPLGVVSRVMLVPLLIARMLPLGALL